MCGVDRGTGRYGRIKVPRYPSCIRSALLTSREPDNVPLPWQRTSAPTWIIPGVLFGGAMGNKERHTVWRFLLCGGYDLKIREMILI